MTGCICTYSRERYVSFVARPVLAVVRLYPLLDQVSVIGGLACTGLYTSVPIIKTGQCHWWHWLVLVVILLCQLPEHVCVIGGPGLYLWYFCSHY